MIALWAMSVAPFQGANHTALAQDNRATVEIGVEKMSGYTQYRIGGRGTLSDGHSREYPSPLSELTFPLYVYFFSIGFIAEFEEDFRVSARAKTNIDTRAGKMRDADWGVYYIDGWPEDSNGVPQPGNTPARIDTLDILSRSDAELRAYIGECDFLYFAYNGRTLQLGGGASFTYYSFSYVVSNFDQWYPSSGYYYGTSFPSDIERRVALTYDIQYYVPALLLAGGVKIGREASILAQASFSPYVRAFDFDVHIARDKLCRSSYTGVSFGGSLAARWNVTREVSIGLFGQYQYIQARGEQRQYFYDNTGNYFIASIDAWVKSEQVSGGLTVGYSFE